MGYTIQLLWTFNPPNRQAALSDIVLNRVLEHYNLSQPVRSTTQLRTYRTSIESDAGPSTRYLTTIAYSQPVPLRDNTPIHPVPRDDVTYVFLDDRSTITKATDGTKVIGQVEQGQPPANAQNETSGDDEIQIIENPAVQQPTDGPINSTPKESKRYRLIATRPAASILPLLQNLLSPFVMGLTKSARAAASTTSETARPTPLPGTSFNVSTLTFAPLTAPSPPLILTIHILPAQTTSSVLLEAEWEGEEESLAAQTVLQEFLEGCIPENMMGDKKFVVPESGVYDNWTGIDRTKITTMMLARTFRESGFI